MGRRQAMYHQPWRKNMEAYQSFVGGLNTVTSNDNLQDQELTNLTNIDLGERGSLKRRNGFKQLVVPATQGKGQGYFKFHKNNGTFDHLLAINGELHVKKSKISDPVTAPTLAKRANANSTLPAATYYVVYTWKNLSGETLKSPESSITTTAGEEIVITVPQFPVDVKEANIYVSTSTGTQTKQGSTTTTTYVLATSLVSGSALPTANTTDATVKLPITSLTSFQTTRTIEAVQMGEKLIIATGTELVEYNGTEAKVVIPYTPKPLEYLYIGQNDLADNPDSHIQDGTFTELRLDGVYPNKKYGVANESTDFKIIVSKPSTMSVEYRYEYRKKGETSWVLGDDWGTSNIKKFKTGTVESYEMRFLVREAGVATSTPPEFIMPIFKVKETAEEKTVDASTIKTCTRILLHWDRIILYGDTGNPQAIYISDLNLHNYFPRANSLEFKNKRNEPLTDIVRFRDMLVAFTDSSIQAVFGKHPQEYARLTINSEIGCIAPNTAKVMENYITFLAKDGIYVLKSVGTSDTRANVEKIDTNIQNIIPKTKNAHAIVEDYQYQIVFPEQKKRFRYYYQLGAWTKDESDRFNFTGLYPDKTVQDNSTGIVYQFDKSTWSDDGFIYKDIIETKYFDFQEPYSRKKLKEIQILMKHHSVVSNVNVYMYADAALVLDPDESYASVDANGNVIWNVVSNPNLNANTGTTFGSWEMGTSPFGDVDSQVHELKIAGKCRRTRMVMMHEEATPNQLLGLGIIFKLKSP